MKFLSFTAAMSVAFVSFLPDACFGKPLIGAKYPEVSNAQLPACYIETSDNRILDLTRLCVSSDKADAESSRVVDGDNTSSRVIDSDKTKVSNYSSSSPQACNSQDNTASAQNSCQEWAASKLPGVPYN